MTERYLRLVQDMYEDGETVLRCVIGVTDEFQVSTRLHQKLSPSPFFFAMVMDRLTDVGRQESPWTVMFADNDVIQSLVSSKSNSGG